MSLTSPTADALTAAPILVGFSRFVSGTPGERPRFGLTEERVTFRGSGDEAAVRRVSPQIVPEGEHHGYTVLIGGAFDADLLAYSELAHTPERALDSALQYLGRASAPGDFTGEERDDLRRAAPYGKVPKKDLKKARKRAAELLERVGGLKVVPLRLVPVNEQGAPEALAYATLEEVLNPPPSPEPDSPAYTFIRLARTSALDQQGFTRDRAAAAIHGAAQHAVRYGFRFAVDDFVRLKTDCRFNPDEALYSLACGGERASTNASAVRAYETYTARRPFMVHDREVISGRRAYVGLRFEWYGEEVTVTSFGDDGEHLIACTYHGERDLLPYAGTEGVPWWRTRTVNTEDGERLIEAVSDNGLTLTLSERAYTWDEIHGRKVASRKRITREMVKAANADVLRARKAADVLQGLSPEKRRKIQAAMVHSLGQDVITRAFPYNLREPDLDRLETALNEIATTRKE